MDATTTMCACRHVIIEHFAKLSHFPLPHTLEVVELLPFKRVQAFPNTGQNLISAFRFVVPLLQDQPRVHWRDVRELIKELLCGLAVLVVPFDHHALGVADVPAWDFSLTPAAEGVNALSFYDDFDEDTILGLVLGGTHSAVPSLMGRSGVVYKALPGF